MSPATFGLADALWAGLLDGGVTFATYLPDSVLYATERRLATSEGVRTVVCAREDEGVAIAFGAALSGEVAVALMEGSGVGYAGLILARAALEPIPLVVIFSHTRGLGERFDYHAAPGLAAEGVLNGLGVAWETPRGLDEVRPAVTRALETAQGQQRVVALGIPGWMRDA